MSEAKAFLASEVIQDAPMLRVEARSSLAGFHPVEETEQEAIALSGATNETVILRYTKGLASKILAKSEEMYLNSAAIAGTRSKLVATIEACQNDEELNAIAWN
ncbi:MAG: hypothetical protein HC775_17575 [Hyellaceae cyanobacterium CSU_1_1]|nr:hypothetical protein [Pleurocapsa sp. CRU_1_2]NJR47399.1 hypothetical protein [Hyellaceae cyanobacterium CSU_1_1]